MSPGGRYLAAALLGDLRDRVCCLVGHGTTTPARRLRSCRTGALAPCATAIIRAFHGRKRAVFHPAETSRPVMPALFAGIHDFLSCDQRRGWPGRAPMTCIWRECQRDAETIGDSTFTHWRASRSTES
jgi:hypothetical protein